MSRFVHVEYPARNPGASRPELSLPPRQSGVTFVQAVFAVLAAVGAPIRTRLAAWSAARKQRREDDKLWALALTDARVMADLSRAMSAEAIDIKRYY